MARRRTGSRFRYAPSTASAARLCLVWTFTDKRLHPRQAQPGLSVDVLEDVPLAIPPLVSEQQRIADCLSSLDELIAAQGSKLDTLKTHKKGLMQQLFPTMEDSQE